MAVRQKPQASINLAIEAVAKGRAAAAVSCGHTGGVMASALFGLGRTAGVSRPAIATAVPRADGGSLVLLDLGANVDCKPSHLAQFALMGHCFRRDHFRDCQSQSGIGFQWGGIEQGHGPDAGGHRFGGETAGHIGGVY